MTNSTVQDNVMVNIYGSSYDADLGMNVTDTLLASNICMYYEDVFYTQELAKTGVHERDLPTRHIFVASEVNFTYKTGMFIRVTKKRHKITKAWVAIDNSDSEQYSITFINPCNTATPYVSIGTVQKGVE